MKCWNQLANHTIRIIILITLFLNATKHFAQVHDPDQTLIRKDTISINSSYDSLTDTTKFQMKKSAWGAVLRSAILPGFGQFYNESYWKIPLVWGVLGYLGYQWNSNNDLYKQYRDLYSESLSQSGKENSGYYDRREFYRDQRDLFAIYIGLTFFLNLVDAYVDAQLFDFDVSNDVNTNSTKINMRMRF